MSRVLVIDDEFEDLSTMKTLLEADGHEVQVATSGSNALKLLNHVTPDLILIDIKMPNLSGYAVRRQMKKKLNQDVPMAYISIVPENEIDMYDADGFIQKPFSPESFLEGVRKVMKKSKPSGKKAEEHETVVEVESSGEEPKTVVEETIEEEHEESVVEVVEKSKTVEGSGKIVMIVDDEPDVRNTVKTVLESRGYKVIPTGSGDECLEELKRGKTPDLILMDIMMPGTPVGEVIKQITDVKIAYLSIVRVSDAEKEDLMQKNVVDFIQKPFDVDKLAKKVKELTG